MSWLIRLYPRAWRDRYAAEMAELLAARPGSLTVAFDLVRGAADAHLHPQSGLPIPWTHRLPGVVVGATGLLWIGAFAAAVAGAETVTGTLLGLGMMTMFIGLPGDYLAAYKAQVGVWLGAFALAFLAANTVGWPAAGPISFAALVVLLGGALTIVEIRAGIARRRRWLLLVGLVVLPTAGALGLLAVGDALGALFVLPYPVGWTLLGMRLFVRGSPTIVDPPTDIDSSSPGYPPPTLSEVPA